MKKLVSILEALLMIAFGVLIIMHPGGSLNVAVRILGILLVGAGALALLSFLTARQEEKSVLRLLIGALSVVAGIVVLAAPGLVISIFPIVAGVSIAVSGVYDLAGALRRKKAGFSFKLPLILALITIAMGILLFANPFATMETLVVVLGVALVYNGITKFFTGFSR